MKQLKMHLWQPDGSLIELASTNQNLTSDPVSANSNDHAGSANASFPLIVAIFGRFACGPLPTIKAGRLSALTLPPRINPV
jgi:hypothetical protein